MEVWWLGFILPPEKLIAYMAGTFLLLLGYNNFSGLHEDHSFGEVCRDSVEEIGLAFVLTFLFLLLIGRVDFSMSFYEITGKTIVETMIVAIGISVGTAQLGENKDKNTGMKSNTTGRNKKNNEYLKLVSLSICGAVLVCAPVASTEEILTIAVESSGLQTLLMVVGSILLSLITLFYSDFHGTMDFGKNTKIMCFHIITNYLVALFVAFVFLWYSGSLAGQSFQLLVAKTVLLAIPASLGASAGRLLLSSKKNRCNES